MRQATVVLGHVELDQISEHGYCLERVEVKPLMLQASPPSFDQGIGEGDLSLPMRTPCPIAERELPESLWGRADALVMSPFPGSS